MPIHNYILAVFLFLYHFDASASILSTGRDRAMLQQMLHRSRILARARMEEEDTSQNKDKLAVIVLLTEFDRKDRDRLEYLRTSLQLCMRNLFSTTPSRFYIFTFEDQTGDIEEQLGDLVQRNVAVLPVLNSSWKVPNIAADRDRWHSHHNENYRIMGDWRLTFMPRFARKMGHRYLMQLDDDSYILSPVGSNLVRLFDRRDYLLAARNLHRDPVLVTWGLPELARFFLVTNKVVPETLFEFCDPPNIDGLYSEFKRSKLEEGMIPDSMLDRLEKLKMRTHGGWNRTILFGNCVMYSLDWFFQPEVQRFIHMCRTTGASFTYRWNEQGVLAMLWQIFVPRDKFYMFNFTYAHRINATYALQLAQNRTANRTRW